MPGLAYWDPPTHEVPVEVIIGSLPTLRQSLLKKFDDCPLSAYMEVRFSRGWSTHPQAAGTIFHLFAAKFLRTLQLTRSRTMPVREAEMILLEACRQTTDSNGELIDPRDIVRVPMRKMPELRMAARKFAKDNRFNFDRIVDVERRLSAELTYAHPMGGIVRRTLTGQLDALLEDAQFPENGAIVIDWKHTWGLPPEPKERNSDDYQGDDEELKGLSYHGYFQQRFYGWLVMKNYPQIDRVTLREFYGLKTIARKATLHRHQLAEVEEELSILAQGFDLAFAGGAPLYPFGWWPVVAEGGTVIGREFDIDRLGRWRPQPGKHCGFCARSRDCPIDEDTRIEVGAPPATPERARAIAGELQVVEQVKKVLTEAAKAYVDGTGEPIPVRGGKGRRVLGWYWIRNKGAASGRGRRFGLYTPNESDRGGHAALDDQLSEAMKEATARAREARKPKLKPGKG